MAALIGVNAPYLRGEYGHDLAPNGRFPDWPVDSDPMHAYRVLAEAAWLGFGAIRVWLCENGEGIVGDLETVHPDLLESIRVIQEGAALNGVRVYWTVLDGNAVVREGDPITRAVLADAEARKRFVSNVLVPIADTLDPAVTFALEVINEPETATPECFEAAEKRAPGAKPVAWDDVGATLRACHEAVDAHVLTAGTTHVFLDRLWKTEPSLKAIDVHVYHANGGLPSKQDLASYVGDDALLELPLIGGECGIPKDPGATEPLSLCNYVHNADSLGYAAAFLWQLRGDLIDVRAKQRPPTKLAWDVRRILAERA